MNTIRRVAILGSSRIPFARSNSAYIGRSNQDMLTAVFRAVVDQFQLHGDVLGDVVAGAILKHSRDFNLCRESVLGAGLSPATPAFDIQQACGTGLEAAIVVANKIAMGQIEVGMAGGVDTATDVPLVLSEGLRKILLEANRARTASAKLAAFLKIRPKHLIPVPPANAEPRTKMSMGAHCEAMAKTWGITRAEQDAFAVSSHLKAVQAYEEGFFNDLVVPFHGLSKDNNIRADSSAEKLATLKPAFDRRSGRGTLTAGNSTPLTDGASAVLLASEAWAAARGLTPLAYLTLSETAGVDFVSGKEGLLMAPAYAVARLLQKAGLTLQDFDFYEIHEAFAAQVLCTLKAWEDPVFCQEKLGLAAPLGAIDRNKLNVKGSSLAVGHPFAATGGRIVGTMAKLLNQKSSGRGLISICAAGGLGVTAILEK